MRVSEIRSPHIEGRYTFPCITADHFYIRLSILEDYVWFVGSTQFTQLSQGVHAHKLEHWIFIWYETHQLVFFCFFFCFFFHLPFLIFHDFHVVRHQFPSVKGEQILMFLENIPLQKCEKNKHF